MVDAKKSSGPPTVIPTWLVAYLRPDSAKRIEDAVRAAERMTSGEIVPMVVRRSSAVGHAGLLAGILLLFLFFALHLDLYVAQLPGPTLVWELSIYMMLLLGGRALGATRFVQALLTPQADKDLQVMRRAQLAFHEAQLHATEGGTGVLIFLSMMERQAVVLADKGIALKLPKETWSQVSELVIAGMAGKDLGVALEAAIKRSGEILAPHFPPTAANPDELPNALIIAE